MGSMEAALNIAMVALSVLWVLAPLPLAAWLQIRSARLSSRGFVTATAAIAVAMFLWALTIVVVPLFLALVAFSDEDFEGFEKDPEPGPGSFILVGVAFFLFAAAAVGVLSFRRAQRRRRAGLAAEIDAQGCVAPAGWYPDPYAVGDLRWYDGTAWSDWVNSATRGR